MNVRDARPAQGASAPGLRAEYDRVVPDAAPWGMEIGWIFLSIGAASRGGDATLDQVIATADGMNHAIVTDREVDTAIGILASLGLVTVDDDMFVLTPQGRALYEKMTRPRRPWPDFRQVTRVLQTQFGTATKVVDWHLKPGQLDAAVAEYRRRIPGHERLRGRPRKK